MSGQGPYLDDTPRLPQLLDGLTDAADVPDLPVTGLALSSQGVRAGDIFLAVQGTRMHGLAFAADAVERKVRAGVHGSLAAMDDDPRRSALLMSADVHPGLRDRREALTDLLAAAMAAQAAELLDDPPDPVDAHLSARLIAVGGMHLAIAARAGHIDASPLLVEEIMVAGILSNRDLRGVLGRLREG